MDSRSIPDELCFHKVIKRMVIVQLLTTETNQVKQHWLHIFGSSKIGVLTTTYLGALQKRESHLTPAHVGVICV